MKVLPKATLPTVTYYINLQISTYLSNLKINNAHFLLKF